MGRTRDGFKNGSIVVCIDTDNISWLTLYKEYEILWYVSKSVVSPYSKGPNVPKIMIWEDRIGLKKLVSCDLFMPKHKYQSMLRDKKINSVLK